MGIRDWLNKFRLTSQCPRESCRYDRETCDFYQKERDRLQGVCDALDGQVKAWQTRYQEAQDRVTRYQTEATANTRKNLDLQYMEVKGDCPVLWINSPDPKVVNHATFANIRDRLGRLCPKIQMILLTYGNVKLWELSDFELNRVGLARISKSHRGGEIGGPSLQLEHKD